MESNQSRVERLLAAAIRSGAERRPQQAFGDYFHGRHASCALGAAYDGMYRLPDDMEGRRPTRDLEAYFDCLDGTVRRCPVEGCRKTLALSAIIVHLNDDHRWEREQIAVWVAGEPGGAGETATAATPS